MGATDLTQAHISAIVQAVVATNNLLGTMKYFQENPFASNIYPGTKSVLTLHFQATATPKCDVRVEV